MARAFDQNETYEAPNKPAEQHRATFACKAYGCQLPGALSGVCTHHWVAHTNDWQRVTGVLLTMAPLVREINRARATLCNSSGDPKAQTYGHIDARDRLVSYLSDERKAFMEAAPIVQTYGAWAYRLEQLVAADVQKVMKSRRTEANTEHPAYAAQHRARVQAAQIPGQAADFITEEFGT